MTSFIKWIGVPFKEQIYYPSFIQVFPWPYLYLETHLQGYRAKREETHTQDNALFWGASG